MCARTRGGAPRAADMAGEASRRGGVLQQTRAQWTARLTEWRGRCARRSRSRAIIAAAEWADGDRRGRLFADHPRPHGDRRGSGRVQPAFARRVSGGSRSAR